MERNASISRISLLTEVLRSRQMYSGGWAYRGSQESIEATCLAALALMPETKTRGAAIGFLLGSQLRDGSWPAFKGDSEGSWATALAICTLNMTGDFVAQRDKGARWLITNRGREARWLWRWKFKTVDRAVRFDPDKYGWPWSADTASWVIPTAFSLVALKQFTACNRSEASENRIILGVKMLLDRECLGGGWNAGNSMVYGNPLRPHVEATAIALLALQDEPQSAGIRDALDWLTTRAAALRSAESLAWIILSLFVYRQPIETLKDALALTSAESIDNQNTATLATALLALKCGEMIHPFEVVR